MTLNEKNEPVTNVYLSLKRGLLQALEYAERNDPKGRDHDDEICLSYAVGKYVNVSHKLDFSFYFSGNVRKGRDIRVLPVFNSERLVRDKTGTLRLCGDWEFTPGIDDQNVSADKIESMKAFFKKYLVLFCLVWDIMLSEFPVQRYFEGKLGLPELIKDIEFYCEDMEHISSIKELEEYCRKEQSVNFHGN